MEFRNCPSGESGGISRGFIQSKFTSLSDSTLTVVHLDATGCQFRGEEYARIAKKSD